MHPDIDTNHSKAREGWSVKKLILAFITTVWFVYTISRHPVGEIEWRRIYWDEPVPAAHCTSYGIRKYTARLCNAPVFYGRVKACEQTPIVIHNKTIKTPDRCNDQVCTSQSVESHPWPLLHMKGIWSGMYGTWFVNFDEMACLPFWGDFVDEVRPVSPSSYRMLTREITTGMYSARISTPRACYEGKLLSSCWLKFF